jgi:hypothetical protein
MIQNQFIYTRHSIWPIPAVALSETWVCGRPIFEITSSIPVGGINVYLLWMLCVVQAEVFASGRSPTVCVSVWVWSWYLNNKEYLAQGALNYLNKSVCISILGYWNLHSKFRSFEITLCNPEIYILYLAGDVCWVSSFLSSNFHTEYKVRKNIGTLEVVKFNLWDY